MRTASGYALAVLGRGHRRAAWALLLGLAALVAAPARAQLPGLPTVGGGGDGGAPRLRLAGSNGVADSARALARQLQDHLEKRRPQIQRALADVRAALGAASSAAPATDGGTPAALGVDPNLEKLRAALENEQDLLQQGADAARKAEVIAESHPQVPREVHDLDAVVALERSARAAEREAGTAAEAVGTGSLDLEVAAAGAGASPRARLATENDRIEAARAALARAHALEARAQAQRLRVRADAWWAALRITPQALKDAEEAVRTAEHRLARLPSGGEADGGIEGSATARLADARAEAAAAELKAARVHLAAARALATHHTPAAGELQVTPLAARLAALAQKRADLEGDLATLRAAGGRTTTRQRRLKEADDALKLAVRRLGDARILAETVTERLGAPKPVPRWLAWLRAVLVAILGLLLISYGQRLIHLLVASEGALGKRLKLTSRSAAKLDIAVTLSWALVVVVGAAAAIVWWAFGLDVTVKQALEHLASPLFLVDDQPVSLFSIAKLVAALILAIVVSRALRRFLSTRLWPAFDWDSGLTNALNTVTHYLILAVGFFLGLRFVGIGLSSLALFASVLGIGIGFGLRNIAENFISGLIILAERPIKIGDYIDIDGTLEGQVRQIRARSTTVVTRDNISVIIPNSAFVGGRVTNWSHGDPRVRLRTVVGVAYGSDTDLVRKALLQVADRHGKVLKKPAPEVQFKNFGDSSLDFELLVWIDDQQDRFRIASNLHFAIDAAFRRLAIEIAFPQMDVHLKSLDPQVEQRLQVLLAAADKGPGEKPGNPG